jgi:hypothetical protein
MASAVSIKSQQIRPPFDNVTINEFGVLKFTGGQSGTETTHKANALPDTWQGCWIGIYVTGGNMFYALSPNATAEVDRAVAATEAGASTKVGAVIPNGVLQFVLVPMRKGLEVDDGSIYFVRESDTVGTVAYVWRASF